MTVDKDQLQRPPPNPPPPQAVLALGTVAFCMSFREGSGLDGSRVLAHFSAGGWVMDHALRPPDSSPRALLTRLPTRPPHSLWPGPSPASRALPTNWHFTCARWCTLASRPSQAGAGCLHRLVEAEGTPPPPLPPALPRGPGWEAQELDSDVTCKPHLRSSLPPRRWGNPTEERLLRGEPRRA